MARVSAAALSVVSTVTRPEAPADLTAEQKREWETIVNRLPADWFPEETWPLLKQYCRLITRARQLATYFGNGKGIERDVFLKLAHEEIELSRAMFVLATKMRITQQSTYDKTKSKKKRFTSTLEKPWERDAG